MHQCFESRIWFIISFLPLKESLTLFQICILFKIFALILSQIEFSGIKVSKDILCILIQKFYQAIFPSLSVFITTCPYGLTFRKINLWTRCFQGLIQKEKVHIDCEKGAKISIFNNKIATMMTNIIIKESKRTNITFIYYILLIILTLCYRFE